MSTIRKLARSTLPPELLDWYRRCRAVRAEARLGDLFDSIYRKGLWGGQGFYSGRGSDEGVAGPYVPCVRAFIAEHGVRTVVDLGCGDFRVGSGIAPAVERYTGIDVAPSLVDWLNARHARPGQVEFQCLDLTAAAPPAADLYLMRQVLQHLSNRMIGRILAHLPRKGWLIVTEHQPEDRDFTAPNVDQHSGAGIRVRAGSGVYLERPPFSLGGFRGMLLEVAGEKEASGCIRTFLFRLDEA